MSGEREKFIWTSKAKAIDLSHHLSELAKSRRLSPLKGLQKYHAKPGTINFAGGMPDPAYFPFAGISIDMLSSESFPRTKPSESSLFGWFWNMFGASKAKSESMVIPKYGEHQGDVDLVTSLQYRPATANKPLQDFFHDFTEKVFQPGYSDWTPLVHVGNTNGIHRSLSTLCNPGELVLMEEWTYPSVLAASSPMQIFPAAVKGDSEGMSALDLEYVLSTWNETARGAKRPHVMYTIPVGQNPTGVTMSVERKKAIYEICVKYDIIIIEDDPYYFLQEGLYYPKELRTKSKAKPQPKKGEDDETLFLKSLPPPYLRLDYQGRVIRLDTFSKTMAPGSRLGWFTCNPVFAERLEREGETTTASACGFSQAIITQLLSKHWGIPGFLRWLQGMQTQYTIRRDFFVDCIFDAFDVRPTSDPAIQATFGAGFPVFTAYAKTENEGPSVMREKSRGDNTPLFSFVPPTAGMYVWLKFHLQNRVLTGFSKPGEQTLEQKIWTDLADNGLLVVSGRYFAADQSHAGSGSGSTQNEEIAIRLAFSMGTHENMKDGIDILASVLKSYVRF